MLRTTNSVRPLTMEALEAGYLQGATAADQVHFTIYERATLRPVGGVNLHDIAGRTATFAISIGEQDCWGKGYGTEATRLMLEGSEWSGARGNGPHPRPLSRRSGRGEPRPGRLAKV